MRQAIIWLGLGAVGLSYFERERRRQATSRHMDTSSSSADDAAWQPLIEAARLGGSYVY
jgi:hypothetical protein